MACYNHKHPEAIISSPHIGVGTRYAIL